jgi:pyridoxal phosphate enzyme (YggS family)
MATIFANLQAVKRRICAAAHAAGRNPDDITLLAVSKTFGAAEILAAIEAGQRAFGESYVQEGVRKIAQLASAHSLPPVAWHFIGPVQSNKTGDIAASFDWVHSVDRWKIARRLSQARHPHRGPIDVCIQVNVSGERSKSGIAAQELPQLARQVAGLPGIRLRGLMTIPEPTDDVAVQRARFAALRRLKEELCRDGLALDTLSMGMSADFEAAILEGATLVRVGSAIFGERTRV